MQRIFFRTFAMVLVVLAFVEKEVVKHPELIECAITAIIAIPDKAKDKSSHLSDGLTTSRSEQRR
jgi:hypothetical protein